MLWSREPWEQVDDVGIDSMPPGRFVSGVTQTSVGEVTVIGVCIPWFGSRTEARRTLERKMRWEDHEQYLASLAEVLRLGSAKGLILMGDFNQIIGPESRARPELRLALQGAFPPSMTIATSGLAFLGRRSIDHIALSEDLAVESLDVISNIHDGRRLSDHFGVVADVSAQTVTIAYIPQQAPCGRDCQEPGRGRGQHQADIDRTHEKFAGGTIPGRS